MFEFRHVYKSYQKDLYVIKNLNFTNDNKSFLPIYGSRGSGKSTFLSLLGNYTIPTSGEIRVNYKSLSALDRNEVLDFRMFVGYISPRIQLIPEFTLYDNISLPLKIKKDSKKEILFKIRKISEALNLSEYLDSPSSKLPEDIQQLGLISRALIKSPHIILADEPTLHLNETQSVDILNILYDLSKKDCWVILATELQEVIDRLKVPFYKLKDGVLNP